MIVRAAAQRDALLAAAKTALGRLEAGRRVFLKGRALALQQRAALYARDELAMSTLRIRVRHTSVQAAHLSCCSGVCHLCMHSRDRKWTEKGCSWNAGAAARGACQGA